MLQCLGFGETIALCIGLAAVPAFLTWLVVPGHTVAVYLTSAAIILVPALAYVWRYGALCW